MDCPVVGRVEIAQASHASDAWASETGEKQGSGKASYLKR